MPKGKRKGKFEHKRTEQPYSSDEDAGIDMTIDNCSEASMQSDLKSNHEDTDDSQEKFEEKVLEMLDALGARSAAARASAFAALRGALQRRYVGAVLSSHRATLADHVSKALRRGKDAERKAAAAIAPLLALQIGEEGTEEYLGEVRPALAAAAQDKACSVDTRTECCSSLGVLCYLLEEDVSEILEVMRMYETIFSGSYLKGDGSVKVSGSAVEAGGAHAAALDAWALLYALLQPEHAAAVLRAQPPGLARLADMLAACSLEVRLAAGGALAAVWERAAGGAALAEELPQVLARLEELVRDSNKFRAKRDRKLQRATFRDILKYFEEDIVPSFSIRCGEETVACDTWAARAAYGALAAALGGGLQALAPHSPALRAALGLGDVPPPAQGPRCRLNKLQRTLQNNAADKARTVARSKNRDKRSAALAM